MNDREFRDVIQPLVEKWGAKIYDPKKLKLIFDEVRDISVSELERFVNTAIGEDLKPKLSEFASFAAKHRFQDETGVCSKCDGYGWDIAWFEEHGTALRCECMGGHQALLKRLNMEKKRQHLDTNSNPS